MGEDILGDLKLHFEDLKYQWDSGQISQGQFLTEVGNLQVQDEVGIWWTLDPIDGTLLYYADDKWNSFSISAENVMKKLPWQRIAVLFTLILSMILCIVIAFGLNFLLLVSPTLIAIPLP